MNKRQLEVEKAKLSAEEQVLARLRRDYRQAAKRVSEQIRLKSREIDILLKDIDELDEVQLSILQSKIYQKHFQESLKQQIDNIIAELNNKNYESINRYLKNSYELGYTGTMYDLTGQGIPLVMPINQLAMVKAVQLSPKVSKRLYGEYVHQLSKHIRNEVSRGIATADSYANIARNISNASKIGFNKSMRIARTEGHRVQCMAAFDAQHKAMDAGADIVKQWDATLDGRTRPLHRELDGQIRELDEPFEAGGLEVMYPSAFGRAAQDINCRCALLQRARWALDDDELRTLKERAEYYGIDKAEDFSNYKKIFLDVINEMQSDDAIGALKNKVERAVDYITSHKPMSLLDLNNKHADEILEVINHAPHKVKLITMRHISEIMFVHENAISTAKYTKRGIFTNFKRDSKSPKGKWTSTFHEIGHAIDKLCGGLSYRDYEFRRKLETDFENLVKEYMEYYNVDIDVAHELISELLNATTYHSISDIVGGLTRNKCVGGYAHVVEYWDKPHKVEKEAFAHFYEAMIRNDKEKIDALKSIFPSAYDWFEKMLEKML